MYVSLSLSLYIYIYTHTHTYTLIGCSKAGCLHPDRAERQDGAELPRGEQRGRPSGLLLSSFFIVVIIIIIIIIIIAHNYQSVLLYILFMTNVCKTYPMVVMEV